MIIYQRKFRIGGIDLSNVNTIISFSVEEIFMLFIYVTIEDYYNNFAGI